MIPLLIRKRRIKCDEARPGCGGCQRSGWSCDGYPRTPSPPTSGSLSIASYSIPFRVPGSKRDREMLHYFCSQAAIEISGFMSAEFWTRTVLQQ